MTIGVYINEIKDADLTVARQIGEAVAARGGTAVLSTGASFGAPGHDIPFGGDGDGFAGCDILICIGGDGTLIKAARESLEYGAPLLGVNLGSLGYLTEVETSQIDAILDRVFIGDFRVEERMMLTIARDGEPGEIALNELYIGRGESPHVVRLKLFIDGSFLDVYSGDGILISTPTGSTAYSLSAGGPVIDPELNVISIVPVCPHVIFSRPVMIAPDKEISVVPVSVNGDFSASVSIDGFNGPELRAGGSIRIRRSAHVTKILRFNTDNFYVVLKNKLFQTSSKFGTEAE